MKILVACEESQAVTIELRALGHEAYSCDIQECSGGYPEWHIQGDVLPLLKQNWDMIIAFPPCTHLAVSGSRHFEKKRLDGRQRDAIEFFCSFLNADCEKIAIENPVGIISGNYIKKWFPDLAEKYNLPKKYSQIIQPYEYGHIQKKTTCLWLKGLPNLIPTEIVKPEEDYVYTNGKHYPMWMMHSLKNCKTPGERSIVRSKTFPGIAKAMAEQWTR